MANSFQERFPFSQAQWRGADRGTNQHRQEHEDWVYAVSWSRSNRVASASRDGVIQVWDAFTGTNLVMYREHRSYVNSVAWSSDDEYIASAGQDKTVRVHKVALSTEIGGFQKQRKPVRSVAWSPAGNFLASGGDDTFVRLWELRKINNNEVIGSEVSLYQNHKQGKGMSGTSINAIVWSPQNWSPTNWSSTDSRFIASAGDDKAVHIWEAFTAREIQRYEEHKHRINALAWSPDGQFIASGGDHGSLYILEPATNRRITVYEKHKIEITIKYIINCIMNMNIKSGRKSKILSLDHITALAWSPDGRRLAVASWKCVYVFQYTQGKITYEFPYDDHNNWVRALAWSPDGQYIASGGDDKCVRVWRAVASPREDPKEEQ